MSPAPTEARTALSREVVADRALALADADGIDAVTIRRLATDLGVTPMALYWHFRTKDDLLAGAADRVLAAMVLPPATSLDQPGGWLVELRTLLEAMVAALRPHPQLAAQIPQRVLASEPGLEITERALAALAAGGFAVEQASQLAGHALRTATMLVTSDVVDASGSNAADREQHLRSKQAMLASLPPQRYPWLIAASAALTYCPDPDEFFAFGIDQFIGGLERLAASQI